MNICGSDPRPCDTVVVLSVRASGKESSLVSFLSSAHLKQHDHLCGSVFDVFDVRWAPEPADVILLEGKCEAHGCPLVIHVSGFYTLSTCIRVPLLSRSRPFGAPPVHATWQILRQLHWASLC